MTIKDNLGGVPNVGKSKEMLDKVFGEFSIVCAYPNADIIVLTTF